MRVWIVGPPGGGKTALLQRWRGYRGDAAAGRGDAPEQDLAIGRPGAGHDLGPDTGRVVYVDRAAHQRPPAALPAGADGWLVPEGEAALGGAFEAAFLGDTLRDLGGTLTLLPGVFAATSSEASNESPLPPAGEGSGSTFAAVF